jgi:hypothetical protein
LKARTASRNNAPHNSASRFRKGPTCIWQGFARGPAPSCLIHRKPETTQRRRNRNIFLTVLFCTATAAACFGISTYKGSRPLSVTRKETTAVKAIASHESFHPQSTKPTNVVVIIESSANAAASHFGPPWEEVLSHINRRVSWLDHDINLITVRADSLIKDPTNVLKDVSMVVAVGIKDNEAAERVVEATNSVPSVQTLVSYDSAQPLLEATGMNNLALRDASQWTQRLQRFFDPSGFAAVKKYRVAVDMATDLFQRKTSDDFLFSFLVLINEAIRPIPDVTNSTKRQDAGLPELKCMIGHCGSEIFSCMTDSTCRTALSCLNSCAFNDQVLDMAF